jgi:hypothetical protein
VSCHVIFVLAFIDNATSTLNLVLEYMDGGSLQDVVDKGGCTDEVVIGNIAGQVCGYTCVNMPRYFMSPILKGWDFLLTVMQSINRF